MIGACVGAFVGLAILVCIFLAWYKRSTDKMSSSERRNAAGQAKQQRERARSFQQLGESEKAQGGVPPPPQSPTSRDMQESDEKNFSMFKKSPSVRTAYTTKTNTDEYDLPKLEFSKYHPTLAEELALENPDKPFAAAAEVARQNSGVSWDGQTLGDDSFLSMRSVRAESGAMSPTMVMAKMTPPATASALHRWESAEVLNTDDEIAAAAAAASAAPVSRNPFVDMIEEEPRARSNNPFFNARDMSTNRHSRHRSRSNSRTSRAQSLVRPDTQPGITPSLNPFLDLQETMPTAAFVDMPNADAITITGTSKSSVPSVASSSAFGSERAMASLIAALDLSKEEVEQRLRVVSMQGSTYSAYSNDEPDMATVREFPMPPGATAPYTP